MVTVSVVVPTYNRAQLLPRSIESVLNQTLTDFELIVVDDGSTDSTEEVVKSYNDERLEYIKHTVNKNGSAARNTGIDAAIGDYIAFLDSDDSWKPRKLEKQVRQLGNRSDDWVGNYCGTEVQRQSRVKEYISSTISHDAHREGQEEIIRGLLTLSGFVHGGSTLLAKRWAVESIDGFDEDFERHQDIEFTIRLARQGKIGYVDDRLVTLYESSRPDPGTSAAAREKLLDTFREEISDLGISYQEIRHYYNFVSARYYISEGNLRQGWEYLNDSRPPNIRQLLGFGVDLWKGAKSFINPK